MRQYPMYDAILKNNLLFTVVILLAAFIPRALITVALPKQDQFMDLSIYRDGADLLVHGINPYNHSEAPQIREQLRLDSNAFDGFTCENQDRWNYYASSNLPLSLLYYAGIASLSDNTARHFRWTFIAMECLLALVIAFYIRRILHRKSSLYSLLILLCAGAWSPVLLLWGTLYPEDKGVQILLMILALYFSEKGRLLPASLFIAASIAFKGLGAFIAPLCLYLFISNRRKAARNAAWPAFWLTGLSLLWCMLCFLPFLPEVFTMMNDRLDSNLDKGFGHASPWRLLPMAFANSVKPIFLTVFSGVFLIAFFLKKIGPRALSAAFLVLFVDLLLQSGSLDRMYIGFFVASLLIFYEDQRYGLWILYWNFFSGLLLLGAYLSRIFNEVPDALFSSGYCLILLIYPFYRLFSTPPETATDDETKYRNSRTQ